MSTTAVADLDHHRGDVQERVQPDQRLGLPGGDLVRDRASDLLVSWGGNLGAVNLGQVRLDVAVVMPRVQRQIMSSTWPMRRLA